jgi:exo-beta-1,3-glucanase (GH17 family)
MRIVVLNLLFQLWASLGFALVTAVHAAPICTAHPAAARAVAQLRLMMAEGRFVAYQPTALQVVKGVLTQVSESSIERDLRTLRPWFNGLITYGSSNGADRIADVAARLGYRAVIVGVWDINNSSEINAAVAAAKRQPKLVVGISLGNERVYARETNPSALAQAINQLRQQASQLAITTTEPFHILLEPTAQPLIAASDFMLVNIHPVFEPWFRTAPDANAVEFVTRVVDKLQRLACGPVLVKETGVPTAPSSLGYTPVRQASFFAAMRQYFSTNSLQAFAYFSAFDAPWRVNDVSPVPGPHPEEAHWGLFDAQRLPKPVMRAIPPLQR